MFPNYYCQPFYISSWQTNPYNLAYTFPVYDQLSNQAIYAPTILSQKMVSSSQDGSFDVKNSNPPVKRQEVVKIRSKISNKRSDKKLRGEDNEYKVKAQNIKRNVISNNVHHLVSFIQRRKISQPIIEKIISHQNLATGVQEFYEFVERKSLKNYVKVESLKNIWRGKEQNGEPKAKENAKLFRIITCYFLNNECYGSIQLSKKIRSDLKEEHLKKRREMLDMISTQ